MTSEMTYFDAMIFRGMNRSSSIQMLNALASEASHEVSTIESIEMIRTETAMVFGELFGDTVASRYGDCYGK